MPDNLAGTALRPLIRDWRSLHAAFAFLMTRSEELAEEVDDATNRGHCIALDLASRLAWRQNDLRPLPLVESYDKAWLRLRALIEDGKVPARGIAVDRRISGPTKVDNTHPPGALAPEQVAGLVPWNEPSTDETWLRPDDPTIFGQGRHWKSVSVHWPSLIQGLRQEAGCPAEASSSPPGHRAEDCKLMPPLNLKTKSPYADEILAAARQNWPGGIPSSLGPAKIKRYLQPILERIKELNLPKDGRLPTEPTYKRALKDYPRK